MTLKVTDNQYGLLFELH